jgi:hypothetical protein
MSDIINKLIIDLYTLDEDDRMDTINKITKIFTHIQHQHRITEETRLYKNKLNDKVPELASLTNKLNIIEYNYETFDEDIKLDITIDFKLFTMVFSVVEKHEDYAQICIYIKYDNKEITILEGNKGDYVSINDYDTEKIKTLYNKLSINNISYKNFEKYITSVFDIDEDSFIRS